MVWEQGRSSSGCPALCGRWLDVSYAAACPRVWPAGPVTEEAEDAAVATEAQVSVSRAGPVPYRRQRVPPRHRSPTSSWTFRAA